MSDGWCKCVPRWPAGGHDRQRCFREVPVLDLVPQACDSCLNSSRRTFTHDHNSMHHANFMPDFGLGRHDAGRCTLATAVPRCVLMFWHDGRATSAAHAKPRQFSSAPAGCLTAPNPTHIVVAQRAHSSVVVTPRARRTVHHHRTQTTHTSRSCPEHSTRRGLSQWQTNCLSAYEMPAGVDEMFCTIFLSPLSTVICPSPSTSKMTESPSLMSPASIRSAMLSSSSRMMARRRGRAP